jgi:hypothetical protein
MDIFAHTLWTAASARGANASILKKNRISVAWSAFWGVFPDLFAFGLPFLFLIVGFIRGTYSFASLSQDHHIVPQFAMAHTLYQYSHSLVIWAVVFALVWAYCKRPRYELLGWLLHILIDIPSHSATFYPTPFLFPLSDYKFLDGISWANPTYMLINYSLLLVVFLPLLIHDVRARRKARAARDYLASK